MTPNLTHFDFQGNRIYSLYLPEGVFHFCNQKVYEHVSDALRDLKGENPVIAEIEAQDEPDEDEVQGDVSEPEDDALEE